MLKTLWELGSIVSASTQQLDPTGNHTIIGNAHSTSHPFVPLEWRVALKLALKDLLMLQGFYLLVSATTRYFSAARCSFRFPTPRLMTGALASLAAWLGYIGYLAWQGVENPVITNSEFTAAQIVARQPPICSLLLSWQFWVSTSASVSIPTAAAHLWLPKTVSQAKDIKSDSFWDQE
jgi:hypothetical protein